MLERAPAVRLGPLVDTVHTVWFAGGEHGPGLTDSLRNGLRVTIRPRVTRGVERT